MLQGDLAPALSQPSCLPGRGNLEAWREISLHEGVQESPQPVSEQVLDASPYSLSSLRNDSLKTKWRYMHRAQIYLNGTFL